MLPGLRDPTKRIVARWKRLDSASSHSGKGPFFFHVAPRFGISGRVVWVSLLDKIPRGSAQKQVWTVALLGVLLRRSGKDGD